MFLSIYGGRSWIYCSGTSHGAHRQLFYIDGGRCWIYSSDTSQGACHQCFLVLMVCAPRSTTLTHLREPAVDFS
jgi:hypothetical protein